VVELVEIDDVVLADERRDEAEVGVVPGGEDQAVFLADELARADSSCPWRSRVPFRNRLPVQPDPYRWRAREAASSTFGWWVSPR